MTTENKASFFEQFGKNIISPKLTKSSHVPFKDHIQFSLLIDILSRKSSHHVILNTDFSETLNVYFLEALLNYFSHENIPAHLRGTELIYLDLSNLPSVKVSLSRIEKDFLSMKDYMESREHYLIFAIYNLDFFQASSLENVEFVKQQLQLLMSHDKCRFLIFENKTIQILPHDFTLVKLAGPNQTDIMTVLKIQRTALEQFHNILIPEDLLNYTYSLAERYISGNTLDNALLLLDSSAARATITEKIDSNTISKPILSTFTLNNVISSWTQLPTTHLLSHKFKYNEFINAMTQKVFGQDAAITLLGHELHQSQAHLQQHSSPFCSFLFAGPKHSGKKTAALALTEHLFKTTSVFYSVQPRASNLSSILNIKLQCHSDKHCLSLIEVLKHTPFAVIMYENIENTPAIVFDELQEILSTGFLHDNNGNKYNFRQIIFIFTTTVGTELIKNLAKTYTSDKENSDDLLQLVMREHRNDLSAHHYSPQEIADEISDHIVKHFPVSLCDYLHVLPFLPLNSIAIERIVQQKLKILSKLLESRYSIELGYAQEVIRHLAGEILKKERENNPFDIEKALKQLHFVVEQAILSQADNKNRSNQLFLQLNDTGQLLRCDWLRSVDNSHSG